MPAATLLVIQGVDQGARYTIGDKPVGLGRGARNDVRILDTEVSRQHATLHLENGAYVLTDRNSSNGTSVNGAPIRVKTLTSGDQIQVGRTLLQFTQAATDSGRYGADKVDLVGKQGAADRANIIDEVSHEAGRTFLARPPEPGSPELAQSIANLQALYRITEEAVRPSISLDEMLKRILDLTIEVVGADRGCMLLTEDDPRTMAPRVTSHRRGVDATAKFPVSRSIVDYVLQSKQGVRTSDARTDQRFEAGQSILQAGIREALCVPMQGRYSLLGIVYVDTTTPPERVLLEGRTSHQFSEDQLRLLVAIGRQAALAIEDHRYQTALLKAERLAAMGQTIAMLSHHIKNILQGVRGGSYLIDMGLKEHNEDFTRKGWNIVEKNQNKIYHLVMDMLTFSTERQPALQAASLNETVADVCELMQARASECGITLECILAEQMPTCTFDPEGIHRSVLNVVINAIDAIEGSEEGKIRVETGYRAESDEFFVSVVDNGPGIPADQLPRIFNLFESTKGARGTGLGLAVSQKIIREHGGEIRVDSTLGQGSRFFLCWPRLEEEQRPLDGVTHG